ncbi:MAG: ABC transporter ATP-binding protein [Thermoleophilaceae bacterium]|nr:ABC transporter ATP-binding protein [Thermoleophilaceae bacterium]
MNERATAVGVAGVSKTFRIPRQHLMSFKERAMHPFRRVPVTDLHALKDVSFDIEQGEFFGIAGRNGSGKSTLLKCMAGVYRVDRGAITVAGRLVPFIELGVGFNQEMTALDNVVINGVMMGLSPREAQRRFDAVVEFAELEDFLDLKLKNYSSGMQVRLAFSLMVQADADVLLIDEVLAVGDAAFQQKCFDAFHDLRDRGKTVVLVTHDMQMIERFCQRAMLLHHGAVAGIGDPGSVARRYLELNFEEDDEASVTAGRPDDVSHGVAIGDVWIEGPDGRRVDTVGQGDPLVIRAEIEALQHIDDPEIGVTINDEAGTVVFGTTTRELGREEQPFEPGERISLRLALRNDLKPARYYVDCGVHEGVHRVAGFRYRASDFLVFGNRAQLGLVSLDHTFELERRRDRTEAATTP